MIRLLLMAFNVAVITYLLYHLFEIGRQPIERSRKTMIIISGILLLLSPFVMLLRIIPPTPLYFLIYPVAIGLFIYMTKTSY